MGLEASRLKAVAVIGRATLAEASRGNWPG